MALETTQQRATDYTIELAPDKQKLIEQVNARLREGWVAQGCLCIEYPAKAIFPMYGQALVWYGNR